MNTAEIIYELVKTLLEEQVIIVTHNTGGFNRVEGLKLEDWEVGEIE